MSRDAFDPATARALDAFDAPPLSAGFAGRVAAAIASPPQSKTKAAPRDRRGSWARRRGAALGLLAAGLMSATAAAAGLFGDLGVTVPALERVVARIADEPAPAPVARPKPATAIAKAEGPRLAEAVGDVPAVRSAAVDEMRREVAARQIATGIERRIERRERRGLPVHPLLKDPDARLDPETAARFPERAALVERVQEIRRARRDGVEPEPLVTPGGDPIEAAPLRRRLRDMTPAERAEAQRWRALRERRLEMRRRADGDRPLEDQASAPDPDGEPR